MQCAAILLLGKELFNQYVAPGACRSCFQWVERFAGGGRVVQLPPLPTGDVQIKMPRNKYLVRLGNAANSNQRPILFWGGDPIFHIYTYFNSLDTLKFYILILPGFGTISHVVVTEERGKRQVSVVRVDREVVNVCRNVSTHIEVLAQKRKNCAIKALSATSLVPLTALNKRNICEIEAQIEVQT